MALIGYYEESFISPIAMPLEWIPDPDPRIIQFRATAPPPPLDEILARLSAIPKDKLDGWEGLVLNDAREFPAPSAEYMRQVIPTFAVRAQSLGIKRYAILTGDRVMFGMGRMASYLADPVLEMEAFEDEGTARAWLLR